MNLNDFCCMEEEKEEEENNNNKCLRMWLKLVWELNKLLANAKKSLELSGVVVLKILETRCECINLIFFIKTDCLHVLYS